MTCKNFSGERDSSAIKSRRYPRLTWFPFASLMRSTTLSASASDTRFTCASWSCMAPISGVAAMNVPALARRLLCSSSRSASARPWFRAGCMRWRAVLAPLPRSARQAAPRCLRRSASGRDSSQTDLHISGGGCQTGFLPYARGECLTGHQARQVPLQLTQDAADCLGPKLVNLLL